MSAVSVNPPFPIFTDTDGQPLENGYIWIGTVNLDPQGNPITVYWDAALTQVAGQPIRTSGGYPVRNGSPARIYTGSDYSIRVQNKNGSTVYSAAANTEAVGDISSALVTFVQSGAGAVSRTVQSKLRDTVSVKDFGAVGDGVTDDTAAIQAAIDAAAAWSNVALVAGGSQSVGGGCVIFPQTAQGYKVTQALKIPTKIVLEGPAKIIGTTGQNVMTLVYTGSTSHTGVIIRSLDFVGGDIGVNIGDQAAPMPVAVYNCMFVNQQVAGIKIGQFAFNITIRDNLFTGSVGYAIWSNGQASDGLLIDHNTFLYNFDYDIYVQNNNVFRITNNIFVGNQKTPAANAANLYVDTAASSETGSYSVVSNNKFGSEGRTTGSCIVFAGTSGTLNAVQVENNLLQYVSQASINYAIKIGSKNLRGLIIRGNSLTFCSLIDTSSMTTGGFTVGNIIEGNAQLNSSTGYSQLLRGNFQLNDLGEPTPENKFNILAWSRYVNAGASFTYTNATPSYMTATDEAGIANNATTVLAAAANNIIRINSLDTNSTQKLYTFSVWMKLDTAGDVAVSAARSGNYAFNYTLNIGTGWQRVVIEFYQTYLAAGNPYVVDITIPNGATITLGGVCCVPGRDVGDLRKTTVATEKFGLGLFATSAPTAAIYWSVGTRLTNAAPAVGQPKGWLCTVAGNPGTWVSEGNL